jgi:hypothetical protein
MELATKLEAALVAYLAAKTFPDYFTPADQVRPSESDEDITQQYIRCRAANSAESEIPLDTGNFWWPCEVELRTPVAVQTATEAASADTAESTSQLAKHQALADVLENAILVDDLPAQLTAAAVILGVGYELTVLGILERLPARDQSDDTYSSGWSFRVYCCSRAF